jgi:hypothetical protein
MEYLPAIEQLQNSLKGKVDSLSYLDQGGFKAVYKGYVQERPEAIKVVYIPADIDKEDRIELIGRVKREIEALDKCKSPEFVQLGSLPPESININGIDYIIYSEEYLDGENLELIILSIAKNILMVKIYDQNLVKIINRICPN